MSEVKTNKLKFEGKDKDNNVIKLAVRLPNEADKREATKQFNKALKEALDSGAITRFHVDKLVKLELGDVLIEEARKLSDRLIANEIKLAKGGLKLSEAKSVALEMRKDRYRWIEISGRQANLYSLTAEAQAENARFQYLVSVCTVYDDKEKAGQPYFNNFDDYQKRSEEKLSIEAANKLAVLIHGVDLDFEKNWAENEFLSKFGMVNDEMCLVNAEGKRVDTEGRLMDDDGNYLNIKGELVDVEGRRIDKKGKYIVDNPLPFYDDSGKPVEPLKKDK